MKHYPSQSIVDGKKCLKILSRPIRCLYNTVWGFENWHERKFYQSFFCYKETGDKWVDISHLIHDLRRKYIWHSYDVLEVIWTTHVRLGYINWSSKSMQPATSNFIKNEFFNIRISNFDYLIKFIEDLHLSTLPLTSNMFFFLWRYKELESIILVLILNPSRTFQKVALK